MDLLSFCILIVVTLGYGLGIFIGIRIESIEYNKGICPICNGSLHFCDTDSQGGRLYKCSHCNHTAWVSYKTVDKYHKEMED